ncbi:fibronectin type III domain-containing protein [Saccharothrix obliqua]|uniref:fibronectin type III domain-containing protein n=1 Tax=Saccharothrix obliqua TaxID=2861747 RepID=UPI001C5CE802|nr:fibronectin type III domain-containing protein [Saccharothrix obliqua]MBW4719695.1 fibronectin type III domain-containing protein [Saccharothrix obliqua]
MERRGLVAWLGGLALVAGAVVVLRQETTPPEPPRFLDGRVQLVPDDVPPKRPSELRVVAPDRTSLRVTWTATDGVTHDGFEVRWPGGVRLVQAVEAELTDLDPDAATTVEVRAVDALGRRSEPAAVTAVPSLALDTGPEVLRPVDVFDGPGSLDPRRWRVFGDGGCLGLRGRRLEVGCHSLDLQSNVPLRLGPPAADGALGRVVLTTDGPDSGELFVALLPEPCQDLGRLLRPFPPDVLALRITPHGANFETGPGVPTTSRVIDVGGTAPPPTPGVRHRWELRVLPDAVVALRDGQVLATASVAVPWRVARPRLVFRGVRQTRLDSFAVGGAPSEPVPASVVPLGPGTRDGTVTGLGGVPRERLVGARTARVVASVVAVSGKARDVPVVVEFGDRTAPAAFLPSGDDTESVLYADFPLPESSPSPEVRLHAERQLLVNAAHLVVADGDDAPRRPLPRLADLRHPEAELPRPDVVVVHESAPDGPFPPRGRARLVVALPAGAAREVAPVRAVEVDLDGQRLVVLPTGGSAGGRHEFLLDVTGLAAGGHRVQARVVPVDQRVGVQSSERVFEIRPR